MEIQLDTWLLATFIALGFLSGICIGAVLPFLWNRRIKSQNTKETRKSSVPNPPFDIESVATRKPQGTYSLNIHADGSSLNAKLSFEEFSSQYSFCTAETSFTEHDDEGTEKSSLPDNFLVEDDLRNPLVDEFRNRLRQENLHLSRHTDVFLSKLLEARQGNIENALILLKTSEQSRKEFKIDRIVSDFVCSERKRVEELFPFYNHGVDKIGRPILFIEFDKADSRILFSPAVTNPDRFLQLIIRKLEENAWKLQAAYEANPLSEGQMVMIMNVDGAYFSQFAKVAPIMKQAFDVLLNCYPECLGSMFIINAPYLFTAIWSIMSIWFDARTLSKIKILGRNYHQELYATIEQETLPVKYGGKCTCPGEENGCRASDIGVWKNANGYSYWQDMRKRDL
jgi:hypothetical protein